MDELYLATKFPSHSSSPDRRVKFTTSHEYNLSRLSHFEYYNLTGGPRPIFLAFTQPNLSLHVKHSPSKLYLPLGRHIGRYVPLPGERGRDRFLWFFFKIKKKESTACECCITSIKMDPPLTTQCSFSGDIPQPLDINLAEVFVRGVILNLTWTGTLYSGNVIGF